MPNLSDSVAKWLGVGFSAVGLLISIIIAAGVIFVMRDDVADNKEAIEKLEKTTAFAERITALETTSNAHQRQITDLDAYGWLIRNLDHRVSQVERRTEDTVRDDWVGWRSRTDSRLNALERSVHP